MLKPDGLLIATFMGRWISEWFAKEEWVENRVGMNVLHHDRDWDSGGPAVLISEWWLREHWGGAFEIVSIAPQFQNFGWAVLRKRSRADHRRRLRPSDDPREYVALRHNIRQLQREFAEELRYREMHTQLALQERAAAHEQQLSDCNRRLEVYEARIQEYETSLSWKTTQPLRWVNRELRSRRGR